MEKQLWPFTWSCSVGMGAGVTQEILGDSCCLTEKPDERRGQGQRLLHDHLSRVLPTCVLNCRTVFPGICHIEDMSLLIGERADMPLEMSRDCLCSAAALLSGSPELRGCVSESAASLAWAQNGTSQKNRRFSLCRTLPDRPWGLSSALDWMLWGSRSLCPPSLP